MMQVIISKPNAFGEALADAIVELEAAENFFNNAESHQLEYANARLTAARERISMLVKEAKEVQNNARS